MLIRDAIPQDAENLVQLIKQVEAEADFMLMEPGERHVTAEQQRQRIEAFEQNGRSSILVAEDTGQLVGYMFVIGGTARRNAHTAYIVIGIIKEFRGKGIGTRLFKHMEQWAMDKKFHRLELTTVSKNAAGVALYEKMGFQIEGVKRDSLYINGEYVDEYYMSKLI